MILRRWWNSLYWWKLKNLHPLSRIPWSAIRRIGQSRLLALTIIVPFLGSLILFNQHVVEFLTLSPELIKRWIKTTDISEAETARHVTLGRLYFVYFGLSFLGIGSALFALLCPLEIKSHGTTREYLEVEGPLVSKSRMGLIIPDIAERFRFWAGDEPGQEDAGIVRNLGEPDEFTRFFMVVVSDLYSGIPPDEEPQETKTDVVEPITPAPAEPNTAEIANPDPERSDDGLFYTEPYCDFRGYPDPFKIAETLYMQRRLEQGFNYSMQELASSDAHRRDVLTLHYLSLDHSKPWTRLIISAFYAAGFLTLLWPTAATFVRISLSVFGR